MRILCSTLFLLIASGAFGADRRKPQIDPESQDGILLQRILQETTAAHKLALLEKFTEQFPNAAAIAWVYGQLLPIYLDEQQFDKSLTAAEKLLAIDPDDLDVAYGALRAAEAKKDADLGAKYAPMSWDLASTVAQSAKPGESAPPDALADWTARTTLARELMTYAEYVLYSRAKECADLEKKALLVEALVVRNPHSKYLQPAKDDLFVAVQNGGTPQQRLALAQKVLEQQPENEDALILVAQYNLQHNQEFAAVLNDSLKILNILRDKGQPPDLSSEAWEEKKTNYTGLANWMAGVVYAQQGKWQQSEHHLRAAIPNLHEVAMLAAAR
jgi:tetratricopeptide (TPR) repeat protein